MYAYVCFYVCVCAFLCIVYRSLHPVCFQQRKSACACIACVPKYTSPVRISWRRRHVFVCCSTAVMYSCVAVLQLCVNVLQYGCMPIHAWDEQLAFLCRSDTSVDTCVCRLYVYARVFTHVYASMYVYIHTYLHAHIRTH